MKKTFPELRLFLLAFLFANCLSLNASNIVGNTTVTPDTTTTPVQAGDLTVSGALDVFGNVLDFGSAGSTVNPGVIFNYLDDPSGSTSNVTITSFRNALSWKWQQNSTSGEKNKMTLDQDNKLSLYDANGNPKIVIDPLSAQITVNGQSLLQLNSSGNLGIGTTTPVSKLQVVGTGQVAVFGSPTFADQYLAFRGTTSGNGYLGLSTSLNSGNGSLVLQSGTTKSLSFATNNETFGSNIRMTIDMLGYVGIGTTTPTAMLTVNGAIEASSTQYYGFMGTGSALGMTQTGGNTLRFNVGGTTRLLADVSNITFAANAIPNIDNTKTLGHTTRRWNALVIGTGTSSIAGNLSIGSTTAAEKLDVTGNAIVRGSLKVTSSLRVPAQGDLAMGEFTQGPQP